MAAEVLGHKQKAAWLERVLPPVEMVQPGLWSIPVEIPIAPLRYVLVYVLEHRDGIAIIDAGWNDEKSHTALMAGLKIAGYDINDITDILVTHAHPDHFGLARRLREETGARISLHTQEAAFLLTSMDQARDWAVQMDAMFFADGVPVDEDQLYHSSDTPLRSFVSDSAPDVLLNDGELVSLPGWDLRGIWTPGHTPGHMCFVDEGRKVMFTGDHVLPRITPNISVHPGNPADSLSLFLDSLAKIGDIALTVPDCAGLPGHEYRYAGISARAHELVAHHEERLAEVCDVLRAHPGDTAWQVAQQLTWARSWDAFGPQQRRSALGEAVAHLELLTERRVINPGTSDVRHWRLVEA